MAGPREAHERYVVQLRYPNDGTGQSDVARCHTIHRPVRLDLIAEDMNTIQAVSQLEVREREAYMVKLHAMELEKPGERADLVYEAQSQFVLPIAVNDA